MQEQNEKKDERIKTTITFESVAQRNKIKEFCKANYGSISNYVAMTVLGKKNDDQTINLNIASKISSLAEKVVNVQDNTKDILEIITLMKQKQVELEENQRKINETIKGLKETYGEFKGVLDTIPDQKVKKILKTFFKVSD